MARDVEQLSQLYPMYADPTQPERPLGTPEVDLAEVPGRLGKALKYARRLSQPMTSEVAGGPVGGNPLAEGAEGALAAAMPREKRPVQNPETGQWEDLDVRSGTAINSKGFPGKLASAYRSLQQQFAAPEVRELANKPGMNRPGEPDPFSPVAKAMAWTATRAPKLMERYGQVSEINPVVPSLEGMPKNSWVTPKGSGELGLEYNVPMRRRAGQGKFDPEVMNPQGFAGLRNPQHLEDLSVTENTVVGPASREMASELLKGALANRALERGKVPGRFAEDLGRNESGRMAKFNIEQAGVLSESAPPKPPVMKSEPKAPRAPKPARTAPVQREAPVQDPNFNPVQLGADVEGWGQSGRTLTKSDVLALSKEYKRSYNDTLKTLQQKGFRIQ